MLPKTAWGQNAKNSHLAYLVRVTSVSDRRADIRDRQLRARGDRTRRNKEHHSKISSARPDSGSGMVMPSARAVFKLMNISTLLACCTGRSAGLPPLRIRPA